jgi:hypothetical protein
MHGAADLVGGEGLTFWLADRVSKHVWKPDGSYRRTKLGWILVGLLGSLVIVGAFLILSSLDSAGARLASGLLMLAFVPTIFILSRYDSQHPSTGSKVPFALVLGAGLVVSATVNHTLLLSVVCGFFAGVTLFGLRNLIYPDKAPRNPPTRMSR